MTMFQTTTITERPEGRVTRLTRFLDTAIYEGKKPQIVGALRNELEATKKIVRDDLVEDLRSQLISARVENRVLREAAHKETQKHTTPLHPEPFDDGFFPLSFVLGQAIGATLVAFVWALVVFC